MPKTKSKPAKASNATQEAPISDEAFEVELLLLRLSYIEKAMERSSAQLDEVWRLHEQNVYGEQRIARAVSKRDSLAETKRHGVEGSKAAHVSGKQKSPPVWRLWWLSFFARSWVWHFKAKHQAH